MKPDVFKAGPIQDHYQIKLGKLVVLGLLLNRYSLFLSFGFYKSASTTGLSSV